MRQRTGFGVAVALAMAALATAARADEEKVPLDKLPAAILKAVKDKFPMAELKEASKETEDGKTLYEVSLRHDGHNYDVTLRADATFAEIEKELAAADLPRPVAVAVKAKYPKATLGKAEEVTKGETKTYEVHLKDGDKMREVVLDADGKILKEEDGDEG
jgi:uncharacterized membrane protein YkoI